MSTTRGHSTEQLVVSFKRLACVVAEAEQAIRNFGEVASWLRQKVPTVGDWRKYTMRGKKS